MLKMFLLSSANPSQECHTRAWESVAAYMEKNLQIFCGKALDAEATLLPASRAWLREISQQVGRGNMEKPTLLSCIKNH